MNKILKKINFLLLTLFFPINVLAISTTSAKELVDLTKENSIIVNYKYNDYNFDDVKVYIYYLATINEDLIYKPTKSFEKYYLKINEIENTDWLYYEDDIISYIKSNNIKENYFKIIKDNNIRLTNLSSGLYFIETEKIDKEGYVIEFENFFINLPNLKVDGKWDYNVIAYPKITEYQKKELEDFKQEENNPKTYDDILTYVYLFLLSSIFITILIIYLNKRKNKL